MRAGVDSGNVYQFLVVVIPYGALGSDEHFHHGAVGAEFKPAGQQFFRGNSKIRARIRSPHGEVNGAAALAVLDGHLQAGKVVPRVAAPDGGILPRGVVGVAREDEVIVAVDFTLPFGCQFGKQNGVLVFNRGRHLVFVATVNLVALDSQMHVGAQFVFKPAINFGTLDVRRRPVAWEQISLGRTFFVEFAGRAIGDPYHEVNATIVQVMDQLGRVGKR